MIKFKVALNQILSTHNLWRTASIDYRAGTCRLRLNKFELFSLKSSLHTTSCCHHHTEILKSSYFYMKVTCVINFRRGVFQMFHPIFRIGNTNSFWPDRVIVSRNSLSKNPLLSKIFWIMLWVHFLCVSLYQMSSGSQILEFTIASNLDLSLRFCFWF